MSQSPNALLVDITRCIGCGACMEACMQEHGLSGDVSKIKSLSASALTILDERGDYYVRRFCMHCLEPTCVSVCPVGALRKTSTGPVVYDASKCLGCRYCMQACPFDVPRYEWDRAVPRVAKCDFCASRQAEGKMTACAEVCPAEATVYGKRDELLAEAHRRIQEKPDEYFDHVYGEHEVGGTSVLVLSPLPFEQMGFPRGLPDDPLPMRTWAALSHIPDVITVGGALLLAIWWITKRREEVARVEGRLTPETMAVSGPAVKEGRHDLN
jgi:formate dehydrogenase iron-sulfur subunit